MSVCEFLSPSDKKFYDAWKAGLNLRDLFSARSYYMHKASLLRHGIDISKPYSQVGSL